VSAVTDMTVYNECGSCSDCVILRLLLRSSFALSSLYSYLCVNELFNIQSVPRETDIFKNKQYSVIFQVNSHFSYPEEHLYFPEQI
jgi:hypothetical protein